MNEIGITGEVVPHLLRSNDWVIGVLLCSFMIIAYVFSQDKLSIYQRIRQFFFSHEHGEYSMFNFNDLLLILQCCLLCGLLLTFCDVQQPTPGYTSEHIFLLWVQYSGFALLYCMAKWIIYRFVNWVFFDKKGNNVWIKSYFLIISMFGVLLFPASLLLIFLNLSAFYCCIFFAFLFVLANFLLLYKAFCTFFKGLHGLFYLFLYFCTLEIFPILIIWKGMGLTNSILI